MLRYRDIPPHTTEVLDLTSLTVDECAALVPPFEAAFLDYMAVWTLHGRHRMGSFIATRRIPFCTKWSTICRICPRLRPRRDSSLTIRRSPGAKVSMRSSTWARWVALRVEA